MASLYSCTPGTPAERQTFAQCSAIDRLFSPAKNVGATPFGMACEVSSIDVFQSVINEDFALDPPVLMAMVAQLSSTQPDQAALLLAASVPPEQLPTSENNANAVLDRLISSTKDSVYGGGNIWGNMAATGEAALRAAWARQAKNAFKSLTSGGSTGTIRLGPHISIEPRNIGKGGQLRKGARLMVRVRGMPMNVIHSLPAPLVSKAGGQFAAIRIGATDMQRMSQGATALADARLNSVRALRFAASKTGGGILAFGPSAVIDMRSSMTWSDNSVSVDWRGFAVRSAKSQSGNLAGFAAGAAVGLVAAAGWPVVVIGLAVGITVQVAWGATGRDEWAEGHAKKALGR